MEYLFIYDRYKFSYYLGLPKLYINFLSCGISQFLFGLNFVI